MKNLLLILCILPTLVSAQVVTLLPEGYYPAVLKKPEILNIRLFRPKFSEKVFVTYYEKAPDGLPIRVALTYNSDNLKMEKFFKGLLDNKITDIYCSGKYDLVMTAGGQQKISIESLDACIDGDNDEVASSVARNKLSDVDLQKSITYIRDRKDQKLSVKVNDSKKDKIVEDDSGSVFSKKYQDKAAQK